MVILLNKTEVCNIEGWEDDGGNIPTVPDPGVCNKCYTRHDPGQSAIGILCEDELIEGGDMWRMVATEEEIAAYEAEQKAKEEEADVVNPAAKRDKSKSGLKDLSWQETWLSSAAILAFGGVLVAFIWLMGVIVSGAFSLVQSF